VGSILPEEMIPFLLPAIGTICIISDQPQSFRSSYPFRPLAAILSFKGYNCLENSLLANWPRRECGDGCENLASEVHLR
jgi:hypothetical protein